MAEFDYPHSELLVSASWLAQHLNDPNVKVIDARSAREYGEGHVPGALLLPNGAFRATSGVPDTCSAEEFAEQTGALGISAGDTVVCYDGTGGARAWWAFSRFGHADARYLNGGYKQWTASGQAGSTGVTPQPRPATYLLGKVQDHLACSLPQAVTAAGESEVLFWDVRSEGEYTGADPRNNPPERAGHLPRAVHLEWTEMQDGATGLFKPAAEMRALLASKGITPEKEVVAY